MGKGSGIPALGGSGNERPAMGLPHGLRDNHQTVASYEKSAEKYVERTPHEVEGMHKQWIDEALALLPLNSRVLELGSGFGRDADYMESQGFRVLRTDASISFVTLMREKGAPAQQLNALMQPFPYGFKMIFASAVLLHFSREDARRVCRKAWDALGEEGVLAFSLKRGEGEEWSEEKLGVPRYFVYWQPDEVVRMLESVGFHQVSVYSGEAGAEGMASWIYITARK